LGDEALQQDAAGKPTPAGRRIDPNQQGTPGIDELTVGDP
jgi:hypothetical protein